MIDTHVQEARGLDTATARSTVRLAEIRLDGARRLRLAEIGLRPGALVQVLHRTAGGGRVVAVAGSRVALDKQTCRALMWGQR